MDVTLNRLEIRALGCLIEKELATPEYYPLTLNALMSACNQKSNRDPVMTVEEVDVAGALESLRFKQLALLSAEGGRAAKYRHILAEKLRLTPAELALLAELLLRGPQTAGELRSRAERMHPFPDLPSVEAAMQELMERTPPLAVRLPRQPGRKEQRYAQLLSGTPDLPPDEGASAPEDVRLRGKSENERIAKLEEEVASLRGEVAELRRMMEEFRAQFD